MKNTIKNLTMKSVIETSVLSPSLIRALVNFHGGWSQFKEIAGDISNHGAAGGQSFCSYHEATVFFKANRKDIKQWLKDLASDFDQSTAEMVRCWGTLSNYSIDEISEAVYALEGDAVGAVCETIGWSLAEELSRSVVDLTDE